MSAWQGCCKIARDSEIASLTLATTIQGACAYASNDDLGCINGPGRRCEAARQPRQSLLVGPLRVLQKPKPPWYSIF